MSDPTLPVLPDDIVLKLQAASVAVQDASDKDMAHGEAQNTLAAATAAEAATALDAMAAHQVSNAAAADLILSIYAWAGITPPPAPASATMPAGGVPSLPAGTPPWVALLLASLLQNRRPGGRFGGGGGFRGHPGNPPLVVPPVTPPVSPAAAK